MFGSLGAPELIIIALIVVLLFGVGKISGIGRDLGTSIKEFRKAVKEEEAAPPQVQQTQVTPPQQVAPPAQQQYSAPPAQPQQQVTQPPTGDNKNIF